MIAKFHRPRRPGHILALTALTLIVLMGMIALAVDIGLLAIARSQCQNAADASALAGCRTITGDSTTASPYNYAAVPGAAVQAAVNNKIMAASLTGDPSTNWNPTDPTQKALVHPATDTYQSGQVKVDIGAYTYVYNDASPSTEGFQLQFPRSDTTQPYSAVKTTVTYNGSWSFARALGMSGFTTVTTATAVHRPRDIVIIMDLSGSMRFESLPGVPYSGVRTTSMNPETVFPQFGSYSATASAALQGTSAVSGGTGIHYLPCNISTSTNSGPAVLEYFFQNNSTTHPDPTTNAAFSRAPDSYNSTPGGDNYLKSAKNTGAGYAQTVNDVFSGYNSDLVKFEQTGYDSLLGNGNFKGYTQGPGYWGKTFFIWPPDSRASKDWRQQYFYKYDGTNLTNLDQNTIFWKSNGNLNPPQNTTYQVAVNGTNYTYRINYAAILQWLNTDPKPFPPILRAGRIKFYDAIPSGTDATLNNRWWTTATDALTDLNERFWKGYIDFVIGVNWRDAVSKYSTTNNDNSGAGTLLQSMIGNGPPFTWGTLQISQKPATASAYTSFGTTITTGAAASAGSTGWINLKGYTANSAPTAAQANANTGMFVKFAGSNSVYVMTGQQNFNNPLDTLQIQITPALDANIANGAAVTFYSTYPTPYMNYTDNPSRPKHQYWFGPMTLVDYMGNYNMNQFWWPGNVPEAQAYSCKIGIQTAIDDIKNNHPNDFVGMSFFSNPQSTTSTGQHNTPVVTLGRNYQQLKDSLWFPPSTVNAGVSEITPWDTDFQNVPRAKGGTAPGMSFMIAYNMLSSSTALRSYSTPTSTYRGLAGGLGRKGANRVIIFETDGAPNSYAVASLAKSGSDYYYPVRIKVPSNLSDSTNTEWPDTTQSYSDTDVFNVVKQICALTTDSPPGYSTSRKKALVYSIGYGSVFDPANASDPDQAIGLTFLQTIDYYGNTANTKNATDFPTVQRIYGDHTTRSTAMQAAFTSILQGGVQVSLLQ